MVEIRVALMYLLWLADLWDELKLIVWKVHPGYLEEEEADSESKTNGPSSAYIISLSLILHISSIGTYTHRNDNP